MSREGGRSENCGLLPALRRRASALLRLVAAPQIFVRPPALLALAPRFAVGHRWPEWGNVTLSVAGDDDGRQNPARRHSEVESVNQPDSHMQDREAEKLADLESLADALAAFRQLHRELDQWERVHLALGLAAVVSGCYGIGALEATLALTPEIERGPSVKLPSDPIYERFELALFERALSEAWAEPARRYPHFGRIEAL
jgi:hypothetical protein